MEMLVIEQDRVANELRSMILEKIALFNSARSSVDCGKNQEGKPGPKCFPRRIAPHTIVRQRNDVLINNHARQNNGGSDGGSGVADLEAGAQHGVPRITRYPRGRISSSSGCSFDFHTVCPPPLAACPVTVNGRAGVYSSSIEFGHQ